MRCSVYLIIICLLFYPKLALSQSVQRLESMKESVEHLMELAQKSVAMSNTSSADNWDSFVTLGESRLASDYSACTSDWFKPCNVPVVNKRYVIGDEQRECRNDLIKNCNESLVIYINISLNNQSSSAVKKRFLKAVDVVYKEKIPSITGRK